MASKEEVRKAFALFDANGDGMISLDELKAILCRATPLQPPLSEARAEQITCNTCRAVSRDKHRYCTTTLQTRTPVPYLFKTRTRHDQERKAGRGTLGTAL